ncbi:MAG: hypothetical protein PHR15_02280 [Atopobiaceae bacterium]|jgi:hypothetical protein|nr:hypothetical protein [Atopobiaceae bacterium]MCH4180610.1 hypothetical protein [Atopobiaceae bacterium]MCH4214226.1 hypothetical protein [Atopobiaceae bacterium]MCH4230386.1 hypothetical protein [Atopobiaceae bacterium]MCH4275892.1 hypothetical protein [Atopobiaceae bacterium]
MTMLFGYQTALELWRRPEVYTHASFSQTMTLEVPSEGRATPWTVEGTATTLWSDTLMDLARPWDLVSSTYGHHLSKEGIHWHARTTALPPHSGLRLEGDVFLVSPELCLLQMAETLPFLELIQLMDEFCGTYRPEGDGLECRPALTSTALVSSYLDSSEGVNGVKAARRALRHAVDGSASPKETQAELLFSLPVTRGGKGFPKPQMNQRFDVPSDLRQAGDPGYLECDLCWESKDAELAAGQPHHAAVEYQSTRWHVGAKKLAADSRRRNLLESMGVHVITLTAAELFSAKGFDRVATLIANEIGARVRTRLSPDEVTRRTSELRESLLGKGDISADGAPDESDLPPDQR